MGGKRILIVDDEPDHVATLAELLRQSGHRVEYATNPLYAIDLARAFKPDVALVDIALPYLNGYDVVARLKRHFKDARMFAITGRSGEDEVRKSLQAGFDAHFVKPLDIALIEQAIAEEPSG